MKIYNHLDKPIYFVREHFKNHETHIMKIGKQLKRAKDTAQRALVNELVAHSEVFYTKTNGDQVSVMSYLR